LPVVRRSSDQVLIVEFPEEEANGNEGAHMIDNQQDLEERVSLLKTFNSEDGTVFADYDDLSQQTVIRSESKSFTCCAII